MARLRSIPPIPHGARRERVVDPSRPKLVAAFLAIYLIWGSTYLAIRFAIETIPPFLMAGARFVVAGSVLFAVARARGAPPPTMRQWGATTVVGLLLLLGGNGGVVWAEQVVPSGLAALIVATVPLWMVLLEWARPGGERPSATVAGGIALGLVGVALLVGPGRVAGVGRVDPLGAAVLLGASLAWAAGSLYSRRASLPIAPLLGAGMHMLSGGAALLLVGLLVGEGSRVVPETISAKSALALLYLIVFGAIIGFTAYVWLLRVTTPARVATYAYVNPVVAVLLGWALADEPLGLRVMAAAAMIVAAVALITGASRLIAGLGEAARARRSGRHSAATPLTEGGTRGP